MPGMGRADSVQGLQELFEKLLKVDEHQYHGRHPAGPAPRDALGIADLYFVEELWRASSKREAMGWLRARQWQVNHANLDGGGGSGGRSSGRSSGMSSGCPSALSSPRTRALEASTANTGASAATTSVHAPPAAQAVYSLPVAGQGGVRPSKKVISRHSDENRGLMYTDAAHLVLSRESSSESDDAAAVTRRT
jgi:hypothetical protein